MLSEDMMYDSPHECTIIYANVLPVLQNKAFVKTHKNLILWHKGCSIYTTQWWWVSLFQYIIIVGEDKRKFSVECALFFLNTFVYTH